MELLRFNELIKITWINRKLLSLIAIGTIISASLVSYIIPEYYKSKTTIFPVKLSQAPVNETALRRGTIADFGETGEAEQAIEILNSDRLSDRVIEKHDLYKHYKFEKKDAQARTFVLKMYSSNVSIKRNKFNSIDITVVDRDPKMAADIANSITAYFDTIKYEVVKNRANDLINNLELSQRKQNLVIDSLKKLMDTFSIKGVMSQFQRGYLIQAYAQSSPTERVHLKELVDANIRYGEDFDRTERNFDNEDGTLMLINKFLTQARADAETQFSQKFIVDAAVPAERKYFPVRWLLVLVSLISAMFFSISMLILKEKMPEIKKQLDL
jgi:uncharacterized protein involved in exopolysaccharide biosynthesis